MDSRFRGDDNFSFRFLEGARSATLQEVRVVLENIFRRATMAARSIATLTVSFGLVSIPVKLYSATQAGAAISFNMLHKACGSRLKQQYICQKEEVVGPAEKTGKGCE